MTNFFLVNTTRGLMEVQWNKGTTETVHLTTNEFVKKYYIMFKCSDCQISQYQDAGSIRMVTKNYWETNHEQADQLDHLPFKK